MAGQDHLHIVREIFAAWNAHDVDAFIKRLDTKITWESDAFPAPFTGHEGARERRPGADLSPKDVEELEDTLRALGVNLSRPVTLPGPHR